MPVNPFVANDPFAAFAPQPAQQRAPQLPPMTPEEESSLLEKIGSVGLGGLSFLGGILNKPGRVVRGLLGGQPREALNLIPFSDALGITDPTQEVRGQDLLGSPKDTPFFSPEGLAGFGVDVLSDPLTYLSFGGHALSKAGLAAKKAGALPATVAERVAQGLGGRATVGVPRLESARRSRRDRATVRRQCGHLRPSSARQRNQGWCGRRGERAGSTTARGRWTYHGTGEIGREGR